MRLRCCFCSSPTQSESALSNRASRTWQSSTCRSSMARSAVSPATRCCNTAGSVSPCKCCRVCSASAATSCASAAALGTRPCFSVVICIARDASVAWASRSRDVGTMAEGEGSAGEAPPRLLLLADGCAGRDA